MRAETCEKLQAMFGDRATTNRFELSFYERDVAPVPNYLVKAFARTLPNIVIRPRTTEEVATVMQIAAEERIPVTPRAGGSTAFFNSVCVKNGILLDLNGLDQIVSIDIKKRTARVQAGMTWMVLERELNRCGLAVRSYPSSARSATVGGWLAMLGYGIGSLKYGPLIDQVLAAQVVLPDGMIRNLTRATQPSVAWLAASEGTLGIVTEVELEVRLRPETEWHGLAAFDNAVSAQRFIQHAVALSEKPFNLHFSDMGCNALRHRFGMASRQASRSFTVAFDVDGCEAETKIGAQNFNLCLRDSGGSDLSEEAISEWKHRFFSFILKREGPSMVGAEIWLPIRSFAAFLADTVQLDNQAGLGLLSYSHVETGDHLMVMTSYHTDERDSFGFLQGLAYTKKLQDIGAKHGGVPYGVGLWNTPYLSRLHTPLERTELENRKRTLDPKDVMNPGKRYHTPWLMHPALFGLGMDILAATRMIYQGKIGGNQG